MFKEKKDTMIKGGKEIPTPKKTLAMQSQSIKSIEGQLSRDAQGIAPFVLDYEYRAEKIDRGVRGFLKEAQDAYRYYYKR
jgi:hypothetical protein